MDVLRTAGAREVYLFGSAAEGSMDEWSDLDFAVAGLPPERFFRTLADAMSAADYDIDLIDLDHGGPFAEHLRQTGALKRVA